MNLGAGLGCKSKSLLFLITLMIYILMINEDTVFSLLGVHISIQHFSK